MRKLLFLLTLASVVLWPTLALADVVAFQGNASGAILGTGTSANLWDYSSNPANPDFNGSTNAAGFMVLSNLGRLRLDSTSNIDALDDDIFRLSVSFIIPTGIDYNPAQFTADIDGYVYNCSYYYGYPYNCSDRAAVDFTPQLLNYSNAAGSGSFLLGIDDFTINDDDTWTTITGSISNATFTPAVPEPTSIILLGTLMSGLGLLVRRKFAK